MFSLEEAARELSSFGLTGSEARAYIALVKLGVAPVSKIAQLSKIRREEIYRMLPKLERLGLVEKIVGKPIKYKPVSMKKALSILFKREQESADRKMAELTEKRRHLFKHLKSVGAGRTVEEEPRFVLISDRDQAVSKMVAMLQKAKKEVSIASSEYGFRFGYAYADAVRKVLRKGVKTRFLLEINEIDALTVKMLGEVEVLKDVVEVKHAGNLTSHVVIVDDAEVLVGTLLRPAAEKHVDLWTNSPAYVDAMKAFFDRIWQDSVDIKSRIEYLQTGKPIERTFVFKDSKEAYEKTVELFRLAKKEIFVSTVPGRIAAFLRNYPIKELRDRGITFRLLVPITTENVSEAKELLKYCKLKHIDKIGAMMGIADGEHLVFLRHPPSDVSNDPEYKEHFKEMMYTNDRGYLDNMMALAEQLWNMGVDGRERIRELETGKPIEQTEVISGRENIYERIFAGLSRTKKNLFTIGDGTALELIKRDFMSINIAMKNRGVRLRFLTTINRDNLEIAEELAKHFEVRHLDHVPQRAILGDEEIGFSWIPVKKMPEVAIYSNNSEMVQMMWEIAESAWNNAIDAHARIAEIKTEKPIGRVSKPMIEHLLKRT